MVVIGGAILGGVINKLVDVGIRYATERGGQWQTGMKSELECLQNALPHIQAVVDAAESGVVEVRGPLRDWLRQLKDALYYAEDVLDELDYLKLEQLAEAPATNKACSSSCGKRKVSDILSYCWNKIISFGEQVFKADPTLMALRDAVKKMDEVDAHVGDFVQLLSTATTQQQLQSKVAADNRQTGSLLTENRVLGRDQQREQLLQWLIQTASGDYGGMSNLSLASLVGHGGVGKTTLVQIVYNDQIVRSHFDLRVWVCVSNTFDVQALTRKVLESATGMKAAAESLDGLQDALVTRLMYSKKPVLVVLDDAWNESNISDWEKLLTPLKLGLPKGSKVLLTTRMPTVADAAEIALRGFTMEAPQRFHLTGLPIVDFLPLFNFHAFGVLDPNDNLKLKHIGEKIAARLGGLPLAAKVIGRMLYSNVRDEYWEAILNRSIFEPTGREQEIKTILKLSYHHLSVDLRPCFVYCSVFPQDNEFEKDKLVKMWMAVGLVPQSPSETLEETGGRYFDDLLRRSFFEPSEYGGRYIMHDLLHELAESISEGECFRFEGDISVAEIPQYVRHLSFKTENDDDLKFLAAADWLKNLRTLHLEVYFSTTERDELCRKILLIARHVRVLCMGGCGTLSLDITSRLKHLRFLSNYFYEMTSLPTFCNYNLQSLYFGLIGDDVDAYGESFRNLISLRHYKPSTLVRSAVRKLTSLEKLKYVVGGQSGSNNKIEELRDLNQLRKLKIAKLENVASKEEAGAAELHRKKHLRRLELRWGLSCETDEDQVVDHWHDYEGVLDGLQPHTSKLKELFFYGYGGARCASWMMTPTALGENLQSITLAECANLGGQPPFGKLRYLKGLTLKRMPAVKQLDCDGGFQQLEALHIQELDDLEEFSGLDMWDGRCFPRLSILEIEDCPKLQVLASLPLTTLIKLELVLVGLTELPELKIPRGEGEGDSNLISISSSSSNSNTTPPSSLSTINISFCRELRSAKGLLQHCRHPRLEHLKILNCEELTDAQVPPQTFERLRHVTIKNCGQLVQSLPSFLEGSSACLHTLNLESHGSTVNSLPSQEVWGKLASLKCLFITDCQELSSLEPLKALRCHLEELSVTGCPKLIMQASSIAAAAQSSISGEEEGEDSTFAVGKLRIDDPSLLLNEPLIRKLNSVRELEMGNYGCPVESLTEVEPWLLRNRTSLEKLQLWHASSLQSLPEDIQLLSSLKELELRGAKQLNSLPQLPASLQELRVFQANGTLRERCRKDEGADWPNIKHIPHIKVVRNLFYL